MNVWLALANGNRRCNTNWICFHHGTRKSSLAGREATWGRTKVSWREGCWLVACEWSPLAQPRCPLTAMNLDETSRRTIQLPALFLTTKIWANKCKSFSNHKGPWSFVNSKCYNKLYFKKYMEFLFVISPRGDNKLFFFFSFSRPILLFFFFQLILLVDGLVAMK